VIAMQEEVIKVKVDDSLIDYALQIVKRTRESETLALGVSPRGSLALYRAAQAMAYLDVRKFATPTDFNTLAVPVISHRLVVNARYTSTLKISEQAENILRDIIETVAVPV
jgi:MoxR-like ATPase